MLIFMQKYFWFCTPRLKTPQPVLPYCRYVRVGLVKYLWSNSYSVALAAQQSEYYARGCSIRYLLYVQQSAMVLYDRNSQYWGKYLCFRLSFFLTFFPITCDNVFSFPMLFFRRKKYWSFFQKETTQTGLWGIFFRGLSVWVSTFSEFGSHFFYLLGDSSFAINPQLLVLSF